MELAAQIMSRAFTPILLLIIFFYQKNKNKLLTDTLQASKAMAALQAQAIETQKGIADTATKHAEVFDPGKIERMISIKMKLEHEQIVTKKDEIIDSHQQQIKSIQENAQKIFTALAIELTRLLSLKSDQERRDVVANLPDIMASIIMENLNDYDEVIRTERRKALDGIS